jgi:hypothetical protein
MADNKDKPNGFRPGYTKTGSPPRLTRHYTDGSANIGIGDILTQSAERVKTITATTDLPMGVSATFTDSTDETTEVLVYDDLANTIFIAQADTSGIEGTSFCGEHRDVTITACSTATGLSNHEIDASASCVGYLRILDKVDRPDNAWGKWVDLYVEFLASPSAMTRTQPSS